MRRQKLIHLTFGLSLVLVSVLLGTGLMMSKDRSTQSTFHLPDNSSHLTGRHESLGLSRPDQISWQLPFIKNEGQIDSDQVKYYANTFRGTVFVTQNGALVYTFEAAPGVGLAIKEDFVGASNFEEVKGEQASVSRVSYFRGKDSTQWFENIPTYGLISLGEIYSGVELKLKAHSDNIQVRQNSGTNFLCQPCWRFSNTLIGESKKYAIEQNV